MVRFGFVTPVTLEFPDLLYGRGVFKSRSLAMTEPSRTENLATGELSIDELNSVAGGAGKTPPKPKTPTPSANPQTSGTFEVNQFAFDVEGFI
jgi:hypothetical protein